MFRINVMIVGTAIGLVATPVHAKRLAAFGFADRPAFTDTLSNTTPLAFGMGAADAAVALGTPLTYIKGRPGDEVFLAIRTIGGGGYLPRSDRLFLQFRHGRLTGWKGDWGRNWMWQ